MVEVEVMEHVDPDRVNGGMDGGAGASLDEEEDAPVPEDLNSGGGSLGVAWMEVMSLAYCS